MNNIDRPDVAERYISASNSRNLRCETLEGAPLGDTAILIASGWSKSRIGSALMRLLTKVDRAGLEEVHEQLVMQAERWRIEQPAAVVTSVMSWWLERSHNARKSLDAKAPAPSKTRYRPIPFGEPGKQIARLIEECIERSNASINKRLRATR